MITVFKIFENLDIPKVGDYVLFDDKTSNEELELKIKAKKYNVL
jgi:hypothetical protein